MFKSRRWMMVCAGLTLGSVVAGCGATVPPSAGNGTLALEVLAPKGVDVKVEFSVLESGGSEIASPVVATGQGYSVTLPVGSVTLVVDEVPLGFALVTSSCDGIEGDGSGTFRLAIVNNVTTRCSFQFVPESDLAQLSISTAFGDLGPEGDSADWVVVGTPPTQKSVVIGETVRFSVAPGSYEVLQRTSNSKFELRSVECNGVEQKPTDIRLDLTLERPVECRAVYSYI